jgi:hypothetical protein
MNPPAHPPHRWRRSPTLRQAAGFDGNPKPDVLWQEDANRCSLVWYMCGVDGSTRVSGKVISRPIPRWTAVGPK